MSIFIPVIPSNTNNQFQITLGDDIYTFDIHWNSRDDAGSGDGAYYFDLYDSAGLPVVVGVKIVLGALLGRRSAHPFFLTNVLVAVDSTLTNLDTNFDELGVRVFLKHMTAGEYLSELTLV